MIPEVARHLPATPFTAAVLPSPLGTTELVAPIHRGEGAVPIVSEQTHNSRPVYFSSQCTVELAADGVSRRRLPSVAAGIELPLGASKITPHVPRDCSLRTGACLPEISIPRLCTFIFRRRTHPTR